MLCVVSPVCFPVLYIYFSRFFSFIYLYVCRWASWRYIDNIYIEVFLWSKRWGRMLVTFWHSRRVIHQNVWWGFIKGNLHTACCWPRDPSKNHRGASPGSVINTPAVYIYTSFDQTPSLVDQLYICSHTDRIVSLSKYRWSISIRMVLIRCNHERPSFVIGRLLLKWNQLSDSISDFPRRCIWKCFLVFAVIKSPFSTPALARTLAAHLLFLPWPPAHLSLLDLPYCFRPFSLSTGWWLFNTNVHHKMFHR